MTDKEIIKALECHANPDLATCEECPLLNRQDCAYKLSENALDLINRQQADLEFAKNINALQMEELQKAQADNERLKKLLEEADVNYNKCAKRFYKEGVKEFAERLKEKADYYENGQGWEGDIYYADDVDNLVKEMVGDNNAE